LVDVSTEALVAVIAAAASLVVALISAWSSKTAQDRSKETQRELTTLTSELAERRAAEDARRSYEYEARKRLYEECEPILFQAAELAEEARARVVSLARSARHGAIRPDGEGWLSRPGYYFHSTLFWLLAPLTSFKLLQRRLTAIDLGLEPRLHTQYELLKLLFFSFTADFELARCEPALPYDPDRTDPDEPDREALLARDPGQYERQGFYRGTLDRLVEPTRPGMGGPSHGAPDRRPSESSWERSRTRTRPSHRCFRTSPRSSTASIRIATPCCGGSCCRRHCSTRCS
jgi:hypothetical protein